MFQRQTNIYNAAENKIVVAGFPLDGLYLLVSPPMSTQNKNKVLTTTTALAIKILRVEV